MRTLITAADIAKMARGAEKILRVPPHSLITPAARDTAKDQGIEIIVEAAVAQSALAAAPAGLIDKGADGGGTAGIDTAVIAKIVGEVLAGLNLCGTSRQLVKEADPCGLRLVRGDSVLLEAFPTGNAGDSMKLKELFSVKDSAVMSAGIAAIEAASSTCDIKQDEMNYILEGTVTVTVEGREYAARSGDVLFIPSGTKVEYRTPETAKWFFVTHPRKK